MKVPDWQTLGLRAGIMPEPAPGNDRLVLWVPREGDRQSPEWERLSSLPRGEINVANGICTTPAVSVRARQKSQGFVARLLGRFQQPAGQSWVLPNGQDAEQLGERDESLMFAWPEGEGPLEEGRVKSLWPDSARSERLGDRLFVLSGGPPKPVNKEPEVPTWLECPYKQAKQMLDDARAKGDQPQQVLSLTDLGIVTQRDGNPHESRRFLEEALMLARALGDRRKEADVLGYLGMAVLMTGQPRDALHLFQEQLALARSIGDRFVEKSALNSLGMLYSLDRDLRSGRVSGPARGAPRAIEHYTQALAIAREVGDQRHEANLLWSLGIQHAELGQRDEALANAQAAISLFTVLHVPQTPMYVEHLDKYRGGETAPWPTEARTNGATRTVGAAPAFETAAPVQEPPGQPVAGPGLLRMAMTAASSMAKFVKSGFKTVAPEKHALRLQTCATCEHHTGLRCRLCGCFTNAKAWLADEECPIKKWPV